MSWLKPDCVNVMISDDQQLWRMLKWGFQKMLTQNNTVVPEMQNRTAWLVIGK